MLSAHFAIITNFQIDPFFLLEQDGRIINFNQSAKKIITTRNSAIKNLNLNTLVTEQTTKLKQLFLMWSRSKSPLPAKLTFNTNSITYLCKGSVLIPAQGNQSAQIILQCTEKRQSTLAFVTLNKQIEKLKHEISERQRVENEIRILNQKLEQRVLDRTHELQQANQELNRSLQELKNAQEHLVRTERLSSLGSMVAGVAHEINTPVGICVTAASYLKEQNNHYYELYQQETLTRSDFESFLKLSSDSANIMLSNMERADRLISSFKSLAVDQISDDIRIINIKKHIEELLISLQPSLRKTTHKIELLCVDDLLINTYPGGISQIINNLINNSIVHGFENMSDGLIKISVKKIKQQLNIDYKDNGIGITKKHLTKIFDPFFTTKRNKGGSGLGMSIIYNLITDKLGGRINVSSEIKKGVHFVISFPVTGPEKPLLND